MSSCQTLITPQAHLRHPTGANAITPRSSVELPHRNGPSELARKTSVGRRSPTVRGGYCVFRLRQHIRRPPTLGRTGRFADPAAGSAAGRLHAIAYRRRSFALVMPLVGSASSIAAMGGECPVVR